jgi:hypothetical protein
MASGELGGWEILGINFQPGIFSNRNTSTAEALYRGGDGCQGSGIAFSLQAGNKSKKRKTKNEKRNEMSSHGKSIRSAERRGTNISSRKGSGAGQPAFDS